MGWPRKESEFFPIAEERKVIELDNVKKEQLTTQEQLREALEYLLKHPELFVAGELPEIVRDAAARVVLDKITTRGPTNRSTRWLDEPVTKPWQHSGLPGPFVSNAGGVVPEYETSLIHPVTTEWLRAKLHIGLTQFVGQRTGPHLDQGMMFMCQTIAKEANDIFNSNIFVQHPVIEGKKKHIRAFIGGQTVFDVNWALY